MKLLPMDDYNLVAKCYWWVTVTMGLSCLGYALVQVAGLHQATDLHLLAALAVIALVGAFPIQIPGTKTSVAGAEIFIFLILLTYGVPAAVVGAALEVGIASWRTSRRTTSRIASPALASLAMLVCGSLLDVGLGGLEAGATLPTGTMLVGLVAFALGYAGIGSLLPAGLIGLKRGHFMGARAWFTTWAWLGLGYSAAASIAGILFIASTISGPTVLLAGVPVIASLLTTMHFYFERSATHREAALAAEHLRQMQASEARFHSAFTHAAIGMALVTSQGRILQANGSLGQMLGYATEALSGTDFRAILFAESANQIDADLGRLLSGAVPTIHAEVHFRHKAGHGVWCATNMAVFDDTRNGTHCLIFQIQDVTARRNAERRLQYVAYHDDLTGLPNRVQFNEHLGRAIQCAATRPHSTFAVLFLDFDRFKIINDSLGHSAGDAFLRAIAERLRALLGKRGVVARLGGDEFGILLSKVSDQQAVEDLATRILQSLKLPVALLDTEVTATVSIGITFVRDATRSPEEVLRDADIAMYKAKSLGKAQFALFDTTLHAKISQQLKLEGELRRALLQRQFIVYYQPKFALLSGHLTGFEALVRWMHPERGFVEPEVFIPLAEETGLIGTIGEWVLNEACRQLVEWEDRKLPRGRLTMNVNVSGMQLSDPGFAERVKAILDAHGLDPTQLDLEVTESMLMDIPGVLPTMNALGDFGVRLSIDDFGTGYSSLSYLHSLPINTLKIDRSFISRLSEEGNGEEIVRSIITLGKALGKSLVAEGVETEYQLDWLRRMHCDEGQGYLFSRPIPEASIDSLLRADSLLQALPHCAVDYPDEAL
jgi:diguanylate cyclase (GGDEF)-like protein/PAS domain S-box-containing protein